MRWRIDEREKKRCQDNKGYMEKQRAVPVVASQQCPSAELRLFDVSSQKTKTPGAAFVGFVLACQASSLFSLRAASSRIRIRAGFVSCVPLHFQNPPRPGDVDYSGVPVGGYDRCDAPWNHQPNRNPTIFRPVLLLLLQKKDEEHPNTPHTLRAAKLQRYLRLHLHNEVLPASGIHGSYGGVRSRTIGTRKRQEEHHRENSQVHSNVNHQQQGSSGHDPAWLYVQVHQAAFCFGGAERYLCKGGSQKRGRSSPLLCIYDKVFRLLETVL